MKTTNAIDQREKDGITILDLRGKLALGFDNVRLQAKLASLLDNGTSNVILNFQDVSALDTAGVGTLVVFGRKLRDAGGKLALLNISGDLSAMSNILKLSMMFEMHYDERDAVNSFFPDRIVTRYDILRFVECWRASGMRSLAAA